MRTILLALLSFVSIHICTAQVGVGTTTPDASAVLDVSSTTQGMLVPRMTEAQRLAIVNPASGLMVYQTDNTEGFYYNEGTVSTPVWKRVGDEPPFSGGQFWWNIAGTSTFLVPAGVSRIYYEMCGGGGGYGGSYTAGPTYRGGGGGGGGGYLFGYIDVTPGETLTITVGAPGNNGSDGNPATSGSNGGQSIIASGATELAKVSGGAGGTGATSTAVGQGGLGGQPQVWSTSRSKGLRSPRTSEGGYPGSSTTSASLQDFLTGWCGFVSNSGDFNSLELVTRSVSNGVAGSTMQMSVTIPHYGRGGTDNTNARNGYVVLYW